MKPYHQKITIKAWAEEDRPREKLLLQDRRSLTEAELIAILIGSGNREETAVELSRRILFSLDNDLSKLRRLSVADLLKFKGIGEAKAVTIIAALELGRRSTEADDGHVTKVTASRDAFRLLQPRLSDLDHEEFWVILLKRSNAVISVKHISKGGLSGTVADPKIIFQVALESRAAAIILSHNHPSGNLQPSGADIELTRKLTEVGEMLDVSVLDHIILGNNSYYSFADDAMM